MKSPDRSGSAHAFLKGTVTDLLWKVEWFIMSAG